MTVLRVLGTALFLVVFAGLLFLFWFAFLFTALPLFIFMYVFFSGSQ